MYKEVKNAKAAKIVTFLIKHKYKDPIYKPPQPHS